MSALAACKWSVPPAVHVFGPGYDEYGNGTDHFDCETLPALERVSEDDFDRKMDALQERAALMFRERTANPGDFVVMC